MRTKPTFLLFLMPLMATAQTTPTGPLQLNQEHASVISYTKNALTISYHLDGLAPTKTDSAGDSYTIFPLENEGIVLEPGMPQLPLVSRFVAVPPDANIALDVIEGESQIVTAEAPPLITEMDGLSSEGFKGKFEGVYPPYVAEMSAPFIIRGVRFVRVIIYPVQYDFGSGVYIYHPHVQAEVRVIPGEPVNPVTGFKGVGRSREFRRFVEDFAVNGPQFLRDDPDYNEEAPNAGKYLIATNINCLQYIVPFIEWRRKGGYVVDILALSDNDSHSDGTIKNRIQERWNGYGQRGEEPFEYLLLVGDRDQYSYAPGVGSILTAPTGTTTWPNAHHADYLYGVLSDGQDDLLDVAYGRFAGGSQQTLELMTYRTLAYQATPYMENPSWFTRGGVYSQHWGNGAATAWHISIHTNVRWGIEVLQSRGYDEVRFHELYDWDQFGHQVGPFITELMNDRSNLLVGRAENYHFTNRDGGNRDFEREVNDNVAFPINLCTSGHGEWSAEIMFRRGSRDHLKGYVNVTYCWAGPMTMAESAIWLNMVEAVALRDMSVGWGFTYAMNNFEGYFPEGTRWSNLALGPLGRTDNNHFGDPAMKAWVGVPRLVEMDYPESVTPQTRMVEVFVHQPHSEDPVPGARVTFYAPGRIPAANQAQQYANYNDMFMRTTHTDADGVARLVMPEGASLVSETPLYITVTGDDIRPFFGQAAIETPQAAIEINEWHLSEAAGNGDDAVNPGEEFALDIQARNLGQNQLNDVTATVTSLSPFVTVGEENSISFGDIGGRQNADGDRIISLFISPSCPDAVSRPGAKPQVAVEFASGNRTWRSAITLEPIAPRLVFSRVFNSNVIPDSMTTIDVEIENRGRLSVGELSAQLRTTGMGVVVIDDASTYPGIAPGRSARLNGGRFEISGNKVVVPGSKTRMVLILSSADGFRDTTYFDLQVMQPRSGAPIGPDRYGYVCFDNQDVTWDIAPVFEWIEINPNANDPDYEGRRLNFQNRQYDVGDAVVVPLPFTTQLYGVEYDTITVTTNGFISMGVQPLTTNYQNWPMDDAMGGGVGMLAPFWDDLRIGQNSGIYVYFDEGRHRFIVEWYRMRPASGDADLTFEVIILDKNVWETDTGDPNVLFQYKTIRDNLENLRDGDAANTTGTPFASVGISGPQGRGYGINYMYKRAYPTGASALANERAILFTTEARFKSCILYGWVFDAWTGAQVEGAVVFTKHGFVAITDENGYWRIGQSLAEVPFDITARRQGYNDSTYADIEVAENDSLEIDFDLLHPEFSPSTLQLGTLLDPERRRILPYNIFNSGNGPLEWTARKRLYGDANALPWELRRTYGITDSTGDDRIQGVAFLDDQFYFSGANGADPNLIWVFDREGSLINSFEQLGESHYGMRDIEVGEGLLWGIADTTVYGFTTDGNMIARWTALFNPTYNIAWDSDRHILWMSGITTDIVGYDTDGNRTNQTIRRQGLRIYGLAYWPEDPDGYGLYVVDSPNQFSYCIHKMNPDTGDTLGVETLHLPEGSTGITGAYITNQFDVYSWVLMTLANIPPANGGDKLLIYQLDARKDWFDIDAYEGVIEAGETRDFTFTFDATGLPDTLFQGEILFTHNADSGRGHLDVSLRVIGETPPFGFDLLEPGDGDTITALPLHGDTLNLPPQRFIWRSSWDPNFEDSLINYMVYISSGEATASFFTTDTMLEVNLDTLRLPLWFDQPITWRVQAFSGDGDESADCNRRFTLNIVANKVDEGENAPVVFGLRSIYPSPFNGRTTIRFGADRAVRTTLTAYDLAGREAARLYDGVPRVGYHQTTWDATNLPSGVYMLKLESAGRMRVAKSALVK